MKKLLLIFLVLVSFASYGQRIQKANTYGLAFNRTGADTLFYLPSDTFTVPTAYLTYPFMARKGANVYIWNTSSNVWQGLTGGTLDTTGAFVTSVYRRSDSVFYVKGGVHTFAFKDSTGGGVPTLQQVLTAGSTLTTDNTINADSNRLTINKLNVFTVISDTVANKLTKLIVQPTQGVFEWRDTSGLQKWHTLKLNNGTARLGYGIGSNTFSSFFDANELGLQLVSDSVIKIEDGLEVPTGRTNHKTLQWNTENMYLYYGELAIDSLRRLPGSLSVEAQKNGVWTTQYTDSIGGGSSSYTFTNGLTDSSGTVKLGGTLTEAITVLDGGVTNNLRFQDMQFEVTTSNTIMLGDSISFTGGSTPNRLSVIKLKNDTIKINPGVGLLYIDTLTSAVGTKALRYNPTTGLVSYADTTSGGSTSPAGNYGNVQLNRNGAFATPASDSLSYNSAKLTVKGKLQTTDTLTTTHARVAGMDVGVYGGAVGFQNDAANTGKSGMYFRTFSGGSTNGPIVFESGSFKAQMVVSDAAQNQFQVVYGGNTGYINVGSHMNIYASGSQELRLGAGGTQNLVTLKSTGMGINSTTPNASAQLDVASTTKGFLPPRMTGAQQNAISAPATGLMIYNTDSAAYTSYNGSAWRIVGKYLFGLNDALSSADRTFNLNNNKFDFDSGSVHIKAKVTSPRSDDIFSVGIGATKYNYVTSTGQTYITDLYAGSGSFYSIGGLIGLNSTVVRLNGTTTFNSFQKKFEFIKEWPALDDSIGAEFKNDTSGISTLAATWADTYRILSLKYRSGVDNSLIERFDFRGNGDFNITGTGATKFQSGNTSQRPATPTTGMMRYNTDSTSFEYYNGSAWLKFGTASGGSSDGYVDNATFNTTTNYLTIEQTGAADVSVRIPPSYIRNALNADSISKKENDSTLLLKAITVTTNNNRLTTTVTRTDSTLNFLVDIKRDTVTLASFGAGGGQAGDTTAFSTSTIYGSFYNDGTDTLVITSMRGILQGTSPSVTYDVYYNDSLNVTAGASKLVTAGTALTNTATGAAVTSFNNTKIPPGVWVWVKTTTVTTKPTYFSLSLIGYKSRKA